MGFTPNEISKHFTNFGPLSIADVRHLNEIKKFKIVYCDEGRYASFSNDQLCFIILFICFFFKMLRTVVMEPIPLQPMRFSNIFFSKSGSLFNQVLMDKT